jgi:hypothetical protein
MNKSRILVTALIAGLALTGVLLAVRRGPSTREPDADALRSVPYLTWAPTGRDSAFLGVVRYDTTLAWPGINLYNSRNLASADLMGMDGTVLHTWAARLRDEDTWHHVEAAPDGALFAIVKDRALVKLDWNSGILWAARGRFHHDIAVRADGRIYALTRRDRLIVYNGLPLPILDDTITILSPEGEAESEISLYDILKPLVPAGRMRGIWRWLLSPSGMKQVAGRLLRFGHLLPNGSRADILHTNSIEIMRKAVEGFCSEGDILLSVCELDMVLVLDPRSESVMWRWGPGYLSKQHYPTLLENGDVLIFDNGVAQGRSQVVELNPTTCEIVWTYEGDPPGSFFSLSRGASQRLPNGNTLITESDKGHVFEVTMEGRKVWEFLNPEVRHEGRERAAIYRMMRYKPDDPRFRRLREK